MSISSGRQINVGEYLFTAEDDGVLIVHIFAQGTATQAFDTYINNVLSDHWAIGYSDTKCFGTVTLPVKKNDSIKLWSGITSCWIIVNLSKYR